MTPEERALVDQVTETLIGDLVWTHGADNSWGQRMFNANKINQGAYNDWTAIDPKAVIFGEYFDMPRITAVKVYPDGRVCGKLK